MSSGRKPTKQFLTRSSTNSIDDLLENKEDGAAKEQAKDLADNDAQKQNRDEALGKTSTGTSRLSSGSSKSRAGNSPKQDEGLEEMPLTLEDLASEDKSAIHVDYYISRETHDQINKFHGQFKQRMPTKILRSLTKNRFAEAIFKKVFEEHEKNPQGSLLEKAMVDFAKTRLNRLKNMKNKNNVSSD